jgi:uncharacterized repeat protein (TIGR01451 family)
MGYCKSIIVLIFLCLQIAPAQAGLSFVQPLSTPLLSAHSGVGALGIAKADFNGDGKLDLAVTFYDDLGSGQQGSVVVMLGNGDGTFGTPTTLVTLSSGVFARGILAKDFDGDGKVDFLVAVGESRQILFFKGHGDGSFDAFVPFTTTHQPHGLQTADLNGDGKLDLVTVNSFDNTVSVLLGNGNGTFQAPTNYPVSSSPQDVAIGDVDGINRPDLVVARSQAVSVLLNNSSGSFGAAANFNVGVDFFGLYLADFDGDGKLDVVAAGTNCFTGNVGAGGCMVFMKGQGNGSFALPSDQNFTGLDTEPTRRFTENAALDLNGDGKPDVLFVHSVSGGAGMSAVSVGLGRGDGSFQLSYWVGAPAQPVPGANPDFVQGLAAVAADFDRDDVLDLAYATVGKDNTRGGVAILFGDTPGTFDVPRSYQANYKAFTSGASSRGAVFGDFTGDGKVDVAALANATDIFVTSSLIDVFRGNGDGSLSDATTGAALPPSGAQFHHTLRSSDLDKNGTLDLIFFHGDQNVGQVAPGNGNGTFTFFSNFGFGGRAPLNMVIANFDGDGFPDLAVFESGGCFFPNADTNIEIFLQGTGGTKTFASKSSLPVNGLCGGGTGIVAADFDKDGKLDLVVSLLNNGNSTDSSVLFVKGNGDGTFQSPTTVGTGVLPIVDYTAADVNKDGNLDLIGVGGGSVYVQLGNGNGTFQAPVAYDAGGSGDKCGVRVADFDGDGNPDIAVVCRNLFAGFAVLLGNGNGTFAAPVKFAVGSADAAWLDVADVDGDGQPDVVIEHGGANGNGYTVLINTSKPPTADLAISKSDSPDPVTVGNNVTYTITVTNNGPATATGVNVSDMLPAGETFVSVTPSQGSCTGTSTISCALGSLANGGSATVTLVVTPTQTGGISNTASVAANELDPNLNDNSATQVTTVNAVPSADLSVTKSDSPDPVTVGNNLTYTITVTNKGPSTATGVTLTDPLPGTVTFVSATPNQGNCTGSATVTCNLGSLSNGGSATVTIVVTPTQAGGISNTATVGANEADPDTSNNSATQPTTVNATIRQLTTLSPARLWVGQNGSNRKLKFDLLAEVLVNGSVVGTGQLSNVSAGGSGFNKAKLDTVSLALGATTAVPPGASLSIRVSVRASCSVAANSGIARLWYNGQPVDNGKQKDAGSRFDATIGGTNSNYFLRQAFTLDTAPGSSRQSIDIAVDGNTACPARPFTLFGTWSVNLP